MIWQHIIDLIILRFTYRLVHGVLQEHHDSLALGHLDGCVSLSHKHTQPPSVEHANLPGDSVGLWSFSATINHECDFEQALLAFF